VSVTKQRLGTIGDRPARPSLIEQVLNQKRLVSALKHFIELDPANLMQWVQRCVGIRVAHA